MVHALTIVAFLLARARELLGLPDVNAATSVGGFWWPIVAALTCIVLFHAWAVWCTGRLDRTGSYRWVLRAQRGMQGARLGVLGIVAYAVLGQRWDQIVRLSMGDWILLDELVIAGPLLLAIIATWWSIEPLERRVREASLVRELDEGRNFVPGMSRRAWVWTQTRHQVVLMAVPLACLVVVGECVTRLPWWMWDWSTQWERGREIALWSLRWNEPLQWAGAIGVLVMAPGLVRRAWDTVPLSVPGLRELIDGMCRRYGVRVGGPWVWRTHGQVANAAILGFVWPFRSMLLTDGLIEALTPRQVEFVVAHEIAHVRERHMLWLAIAMLGTVFASGWVVEVAMGMMLARGVIAGPSMALMFAGAGLSIAIGLLVFGWISRRFEWHADAFAIAHLARAARGASATGASQIAHADAETARSTLGVIARFNGMSEEAFTFRHGSIVERQRRADASAGGLAGNLPIDALVRRIKVASLVVLAVGLWSVFWSPGQRRAEAARANGAGTTLVQTREFVRSDAP
jgi:Zn-dependent protease with chaperone function